MTMTPLTIAMVQAKFATADLRANIQKIVGIAKKLHRQDVDLLVLPELALPGVAMQDLLLRKSFLLEQEVALEALAK